jgi:hypothetical protein
MVEILLPGGGRKGVLVRRNQVIKKYGWLGTLLTGSCEDPVATKKSVYQVVFGSEGSVFFWASRIRIRIRHRILPLSSKNSKKNLDF